MDECCCNQGPPILQLARAVSVLTVRTFHISSPPGIEFFCGRRFFRQCNVVAVDNGRCGFALPDQDSQANVPIFAEHITGLFDPCVTPETLHDVRPYIFSDDSMSCRLAPGGGAFDCWNAIYSLTVETLPEDLIAACLANLSLIQLDQVPFGVQRRVVNDFFNGSPAFSDSFIDTSPPLPDACPSPLNHPLAASFAFRFAGQGEVAHCTNTQERRVQMPTYSLIVSASRSRFSVNSTWCKRTRGPILIDPTFSTNCISTTGACADTACAHYLPATGVIDVPALNESVHIGLCTAPAAPCNPTPIPF